MNNEKAIDIFNKLIQINNDRIKGYKMASKETEEKELQDIFGRFITTSLICKDELANEVILSGETPAEDTPTLVNFFRAWIDVKAALSDKDRELIINFCEYAEDMAKDMYKKALEYGADKLTPEKLSIIEKQLVMLKEDHDAVKEMRHMLA